MRRAVILSVALASGGVSQAYAQPVHWDLECKYNNGSIAFLLNYAEHRTMGDMVAHAHQVSISDSLIKFSVSASETTLLQDFDVTVDRASLKWTTNKPGWGGACRKL